MNFCACLRRVFEKSGLKKLRCISLFWLIPFINTTYNENKNKKQNKQTNKNKKRQKQKQTKKEPKQTNKNCKSDENEWRFNFSSESF